MKKQLKRTAIGSMLMVLLAVFTLNLTSCKKKEERKPADFVVGDYVGSGMTADFNPFVNATIRVTKVSKSRIKIEPVGHSYITTFEVDIKYIESGKAVVDTDGQFALAFSLEESPISFGFGSGVGQVFGGEKQ